MIYYIKTNLNTVEKQTKQYHFLFLHCWQPRFHFRAWYSREIVQYLLSFFSNFTYCLLSLRKNLEYVENLAYLENLELPLQKYNMLNWAWSVNCACACHFSYAYAASVNKVTTLQWNRYIKSWCMYCSRTDIRTAAKETYSNRHLAN